MSIMRCALHDTQYDSDKFDICPVCECVAELSSDVALPRQDGHTGPHRPVVEGPRG
jgi:hypothetical protein